MGEQRCSNYNLIRLRGFRWLDVGTLSTGTTVACRQGRRCGVYAARLILGDRRGIWSGCGPRANDAGMRRALLHAGNLPAKALG